MEGLKGPPHSEPGTYAKKYTGKYEHRTITGNRSTVRKEPAASGYYSRLRRGSILERCHPSLKPGGKLVTVVSTQPLPQRADVQPIFFYAEVTAARLRTLTTLFEERRIAPRVGSILPLDHARTAHQMLAGARTSPAKSSCRSHGSHLGPPPQMTTSGRVTH